MAISGSTKSPRDKRRLPGGSLLYLLGERRFALFATYYGIACLEFGFGVGSVLRAMSEIESVST